MKKLLGILGGMVLLSSVSFATETQSLIEFADKAIAEKKLTVDQLITTMQSIHTQQKSDLSSALVEENTTKAGEIYAQWSKMYPLTIHLHDIKAGSGKYLTNASGVQYSFKMQTKLPWMNMSWGENEYYAFPKNDAFLEVKWDRNQGGMIYNDTAISYYGQSIGPKYFYAGENTLQDVSWKTTEHRIMNIEHADTDLYYFFDVPAKIENFPLIVADKSIDTKNIYEMTSYSPDYYVTSLDKGFQFCQKVSEFTKEKSTNKEYSTKECNDAANMKFYNSMNQDILTHAANLYL